MTEHIALLTGVGADTRSNYRGQPSAHIAPPPGPLAVSAVTCRHVAGWVLAMTEKGPSPKTIANVHGLLSAAMTTAVRLGYRAGNPCVGSEPPKAVATREMTVLTRDELPRAGRRLPRPRRPRRTKRPRVHDLRHTHASWMIAGADLLALQRRLGHESITTMAETYAHLLPDQQHAAADAVGRAMRGLATPAPAPER